MADQVLFKTSTQAAYNGLSTKDANTFYKTNDGHLYLGSHTLDNAALTGYTSTDLNRAVSLSGDKAYVTLPTPINTLTSTSTSLPLSANMGKSLQDQITSLNSKLASNQTNSDVASSVNATTWTNLLSLTINTNGNYLLLGSCFISEHNSNGLLGLNFYFGSSSNSYQKLFYRIPNQKMFNDIVFATQSLIAGTQIIFRVYSDVNCIVSNKRFSIIRIA